jgi:DNA-directed RNA polymerase subunit L
MEIKTLKKTPNELRIEIEGVGHTVCNLLQKRLVEDEDVDLAGYDVPHPLASSAIIYVRTKGSVRPEAALQKALEKVRETDKEFSKELQRALKKA